MVLGFGGGSSIDTAKSIALLAVNEGDFWDYVATGSGKGLKIKNRPLPVIAVPTTAGTGTEADPWLYDFQPKVWQDNEQMQAFVEMCFEPSSPANAKLKETLLQMLKEQQK